MLNLTRHILQERSESETGLCCLRTVHLLEDLGVPRREALMLSPDDAAITLSIYIKARLIDSLLAQEVQNAT